jgi:hypothetical protein
VGKVMSMKEAADKVEEHLEKKEVERKKLSKVQTLWNAVPKGPIKELAKETPIKKPIQTLTNQLSASAKVEDPNRIITDAERVQKAIMYGRSLLEAKRA